MKRDKARKWMIKKLGGYVENPLMQPVPVIVKKERKLVKVVSDIKCVPSIRGEKPPMEWEKQNIAGDLVNRIVKEGLVRYEFKERQEDDYEDCMILRAEIVVAEPEEKK